MGTNYYIKGYNTEKNDQDEDCPKWHIGKRSAAGKFCFDCGITLCKGGAAGVHYDDDWYDKCPICGKKYVKEEMDKSSGGLELGFNKDATVLKDGVSTTSSFYFAMDYPELVDRLQEEFGKDNPPDGDKRYDVDQKIIEDEYGREFSYMEFLDLMRPIPTSLFFKHLIGQEFS